MTNHPVTCRLLHGDPLAWDPCGNSSSNLPVRWLRRSPFRLLHQVPVTHRSSHRSNQVTAAVKPMDFVGVLQGTVARRSC
ncbi:unnamed protein product [Haemonchus placei]|uniref:Transposase n=1 Tax=Haemonchus placei TaxID=6290 RepID=A0A0N4WF74_HAEPC|nr:unnamed protein product [Haemonchus placei]